MDKDKGINHVGGLPPSGRYSMFSSPGNSFSVKPESAALTSLPPLGSGCIAEASLFGQGMTSESSRFSHDVNRMPDNPPKNSGHRRAHSEILTLPDDISFDSDLGVVGALDGPSFSDDTEEDPFSYLDIDKINYSSATSNFQAGESSSAAGATALNSSTPASSSMVPPSDMVSGMTDKPRVRHQHSHSMDGSTTIKAEMLAASAEELSQADAKKSMSAAKLAELALIDPKRAKRIWANRQSAARSKERKMRYIAELERKVQTLQTEATSLSAQLTLLQRDTNGLTAENSELKMRLQSMEQQVHLQDALNDALKEEIQHLKVLTGQIPNGGPMMSYPQSFGTSQQYYMGNHAAHTMLTAQQFQQLQINTQKQQQQQFQQQQQHLHEYQQQPQQSFIQPHDNLLQQPGDLKFRGSVQSSTPTDGASDMNASSSKD